MKKVKYIYAFFIVLLFGLFSFACSDDDIDQTEENGDGAAYKGKPIETSFKVCVSAPDVSVDLDGVTRAGDAANKDYAQPENGGRFQNIVIVVTDNSGKVYGLHCNKWYSTKADPTSVGVKDYEYVFPDMKIIDTKAKVYVFGNVSADDFEAIEKYTVNTTTLSAWTASYLPKIRMLATTNISVDEANLYNISFKPKAGNFKVNNSNVTTYCTGMPVNAMATADVKKGATVFNVHMKRVCARLQVTFRNFTGKYIDYKTGDNKDNNVYVDKFVLKGVLASSTNYFYNGSDPSTGSVDFDILKALGGSKTNDHIINKIENGKDLVVSMYVFENKKGTTTGAYTYDLKVDRGKSLGLNTTVIDPENAYVIWNRINSRSIAYNNKVTASDVQTEADKIPFKDQVFWTLQRDGNVSDAYLLRRMPMNVEKDSIDLSSTSYLKNVGDPDWDSDKYKEVPGELTSSKDEAQYIQIGQNGKANEFTFSLMGNSTIDYWGYHTYILFPRKTYSMLTINEGKLVKRSSEFVLFGSQQKANYEWTLYAKYIIKNGATFIDKNISKIDRNHSYELDFSVMPNYDTKQELLVNCVRKQSEISWSETQK